jgi:hypothetical protein
MRGFIYRLGMSIKETGERLRLNFLIRFGLSIREFAMGL